MISSSDKIVFHVQSREVKGTKNISKLRRSGKIMGNIYGLKKDSVPVLMDQREFEKLFQSHGDSGLLYLELDEKKDQVPVLIDSIDTKPVGSQILHVSFRRVDLKKTVETEVSVVVIGEVDIPQAVVSLVRDTVVIEALPADIPEKFEINISSLTEVGQSLTLADLSVDTSKLNLVLEEDEKPEDVTLVVVQEVKEEVIEEPEEVTLTPDGEVAGEGDGNAEKGVDAGEKSSGDSDQAGEEKVE